MNKSLKIVIATLLFFGMTKNVFACGFSFSESSLGGVIWILYIAIASIFAYLLYLIKIDKIKYKNKKTASFLFFLLFLFFLFIIPVFDFILTAPLCGTSRSF